MRRTRHELPEEWTNKTNGSDLSVYLLERRSMLLSGSEKFESTVQKESDMLTPAQTLEHRCDTAALSTGRG